MFKMPALNDAISQRRFRQVNFLIDCGVNLNSKNSAGQTPLVQLCDLEPEERAVNLAKLFIKRGAKIDRKDSNGRSALMCAILKGKKKLISLFLGEKLDFDVNAKDDDGNTALAHAAYCGNLEVVGEIVQSLRQFGLSVDTTNNESLTPMMIASKHGNFECAELILHQGKASKFIRDDVTWKNASEWEKTVSLENLTSESIEKVNLRRAKTSIARPTSRSSSSSRSMHLQRIQKHEIQQLYNVYEDQLSSTYRIGFINNKIGKSYEEPSTPNSDELQQPLKGNQTAILFTKSAAIVKFRKNSSMFNARKLTKRDLSSSYPEGSLSGSLKEVLETKRELTPKQDIPKQRPKRPVRSRSEILYSKIGAVKELEKQIGKAHFNTNNKLPRIQSSPVMAVLEENEKNVK